MMHQCLVVRDMTCRRRVVLYHRSSQAVVAAILFQLRKIKIFCFCFREYNPRC
jgi:hypothetical protein